MCDVHFVGLLDQGVNDTTGSSGSVDTEVPLVRVEVRQGQPDPVRSVHGVRLSRGVDDPVWDRFVEEAPTGHYTQSVSWARFRSTFGWETARVMVWNDDQLVAGAQILLRPLRGLGAVGYVLHGPVVASEDPEVADLAIESLLHFCRREKVRYLVLRPAYGGHVTTRHLHDLGFRRNDRLDKPSVTAQVDLTPDPDDILARMRKSTRANVRRGLSRGLTARRGDGADLDTLLHLYRMAAARKGFPNPSASRYRALWRSFDADGRGALFLVEDEGDPVSAQLAIRFGGRVYSHLMAWSGEHANRKPNELLDWTVMMWARAEGCRYYDFEGAGGTGASADAPAGPDLVAPGDAWVSDYKRGFGAQVVPASLDFDYAVNPLLRWGHTNVLPRIEHRPAAHWLDLKLQRVVAGRGRPARGDHPRARPPAGS